MSGFVLYVSDVDLEPIKLNSSKTTAVFDATFIWRFCKKVIVCNSYKHIYLDKYSSGLGFRIRILTILAWSNSGVSVANNLYINTHQTRCFLGRKLIYNVNYIQGVFTILFGVEKTRTQVCNLNLIFWKSFALSAFDLSGHIHFQIKKMALARPSKTLPTSKPDKK